MLPRLTTASVCTLALLACGSARQVERHEGGGTIALHGDRHESAKDAREMMLEHCRGPYQIIEQGKRSDDGEWRMRYRCGQAPRKVAEPDGDLPPSPDDGYPMPAVKGPRDPAPVVDAGAADESFPVTRVPQE